MLGACGAVLALMAGLGVGGTQSGVSMSLADTALAAAGQPSMTGLHVSGNTVLNSSGRSVRLLGVDRGAAGPCIQGWGIFSGPADESTVQAMATWNITAVRIPLNEDCWLGINGAPAQYGGANYQQAIVAYVNLLTKYNMATILDLHWNAPGTIQSVNQQPMADADHAPAFWSSVANTFKVNTSVVFDLYNEPYPDNNQDTTAAWSCLLNGCQQTYYVDANGTNISQTWQAAGMNQLVSAVRSTGATNLVMTAGVGWAGLMTSWLQYVPTDSINNLAASTHIYPNTWCSTTGCWDSVLAPIAAKYPIITGEIGESDCAHTFIDSLMTWMDQHQQSYVAWHWWPLTDVPCSDYALITDYASAAPSNFGAGLKAHLANLNGGGPTSSPTPTPSATGTPTQTNSPTPTTTPIGSPTPTATPTSSPTLRATPTSVSSPFAATARVSRATVKHGGRIVLSSAGTSGITGSLLVDVEVYDPSGNKVFQQVIDNQAFKAGQKRSYSVGWAVPTNASLGSYTVKVGIFGAGWSTLYYWNDQAAQFKVS